MAFQGMLSVIKVIKVILPKHSIENQGYKLFRLREAFFLNKRNYSSDPRILKSLYSSISLPSVPLHRYVWRNLNKWPDVTAVECGVSGKKYSYKDLHSKCLKLAESLKKLGLKRGDVIAVILPNSTEFPIACLGSLEYGAVITTINPHYTKDEIANQLIDSGSKCLICHPSNLSVVIEAKNQIKKDINIICTHDIDGTPPKSEGIILFEELICDSVKMFENQEDVKDLHETIFIPYSSGTTGKPKGVCLTHSSLTANLAQMTSPEVSNSTETHGDFQAVLPAILPLYHCYGIMATMMNPLSKGSKIITLPKFDPKYFLKILESNKNLYLYIVPPIVFYLGSSNDVHRKHLAGVNEMMSGAAPCSAHDYERVLSKAGKPFICSQGYGMTEFSPAVTLYVPKIDEDFLKNSGSVGKIMPNTVGKVVSLENGETLPSNRPGELHFKGPQQMKCYLNNPEATAEAVDSEGWLHTGDVGYYDDNGFFYVTDRIKELIKVKGYQVAPAELEDVIRRFPGVVEAGVVGAPSEKTGETPVAFVEITPGSNISEDDIKKFLASQLSKHKHLSSVRFLKSIPKTATGKILRKELKNLV